MAAAVELRGVSKVFRLRHNAAKNLKVRRIGLYNLRHRERVKEFWALRDIEPTVRTRECFGLIGPNGSGKSTLLRVMAGILRPTTAHVVVSERVAPMIELGVGFHPDLTGEENIYLNTSLFWFSRQEAEAIYRDVVAFSELQHFIDQPAKNYSVGMLGLSCPGGGAERQRSRGSGPSWAAHALGSLTISSTRRLPSRPGYSAAGIVIMGRTIWNGSVTKVPVFPSLPTPESQCAGQPAVHVSPVVFAGIVARPHPRRQHGRQARIVENGFQPRGRSPELPVRGGVAQVVDDRPRHGQPGRVRLRDLLQHAEGPLDLSCSKTSASVSVPDA